MLTQQEQAGAKDALKWAARTYVVAALGSIATYIMFRFIWEEAGGLKKKRTMFL
jgi:Zn-dependent membrane protease YugP